MKLLFILIKFFRDIIFDSKDEYDFKSSAFNTRKFFILILISLLSFTNIVTFKKLIIITKHNIELSEELANHENKFKEKINSNRH